MPATPPNDDPARLEKFMRRAFDLARKGAAAGDGGPFGSVVVKGDQVIGEGWNHVVSHNDPTAHGEIFAIRDACANIKSFNLAGCELFTSGDPCPMCLAASYWARLDRVYFGFSMAQAATVDFDDQAFFAEFAKPADQRRLPVAQVLGDEAFAILKEYAADPKRVKY